MTVERSFHDTNQQAVNVAFLHGCPHSMHDLNAVPAGCRLSRARLRHLRDSETIVVTLGGVHVGLAAYKPADSDVRIVHEFLIDRNIGERCAASVTEKMVSALEVVSRDDAIRWLLLVLEADVPVQPLIDRGYTPLVVDAAGAWMQKRLAPPTWTSARFLRPH